MKTLFILPQSFWKSNVSTYICLLAEDEKKKSVSDHAHFWQLFLRSFSVSPCSKQIPVAICLKVLCLSNNQLSFEFKMMTTKAERHNVVETSQYIKRTEPRLRWLPPSYSFALCWHIVVNYIQHKTVNKRDHETSFNE